MALDHYVQRAFIEGFTGSDGALYLFDKKLWKLRYPVHPANVLSKRDYETPTWAEMMRAVENCGMEGISLLRARKYESLTSEILGGLLVYLIAHTARSPHHFDELRARTSEDREVAFLTEMPYRILNSGDVTFHLREFPHKSVPLYLTDNPVTILPVAEEKALITFPIASHLMIAGIFPSPAGEVQGLAWNSRPQRDSDDVAKTINTALFRRAARFVLCKEKITPPVGQK
jgi:hypothetical protein